MAGAVTLYFTAPRTVELRDEPLPDPAGDQLRVRTLLSGISAGTELLIYRGEAPNGLPADEVLPGLDGMLAFPLRYGYSAVGQVEAAGPQAPDGWLGRRVFAFQPHGSHFLAPPDQLTPLPDDLPDELAVLLPTMETALHLVHEGAPRAGECVLVCGQGLVGLLTAALLARFPLQALAALDPLPARRETARRLGAHVALDPMAEDPRPAVLEAFAQSGEAAGADLTFELSGRPEALDQALALTGYDGRLVLGSWYGRKAAQLDLGGRFHRSHIRIQASQVSRVQPGLSGRWTKTRRLHAALQLLRLIHPAELVTHRFALADAAQAYRLLDTRPEAALQVVLSCDS